MSTPTQNSVPVSFVDPGAGNVAALTGRYEANGDATKWGGAAGTGVSLTYSFPTDHAWWIDPYSVGGDGEFSSWYQLSSKEREGVRAALDSWSSVANIAFTEVADNETVVGDLRFASTGVMSDDFNGSAYFPDDHPTGGDVWFNVNSWHTQSKEPVTLGSYDYLTILHEIGHALGLKHHFEGPQPIDPALDSYSYTVMSYSAQAGSGDGWANFYPTTPMWLDILAIQQLYGVGPHNEGDNVYSYSSSGQYWETIHDTGGNDTIRVTGREGAVINLNIGEWSEIGKKLKFNTGKQTDTVMIGPDTVIENATGGKGDDWIVGNAVGNGLNGGKGNDALIGRGGADYLLGGKGGDTFFFAAGFGNDTIGDFSTKKGDAIRFEDGLFADFAAVMQAVSLNAANQVVITAGADTVTLASVFDPSSLKANDFVFA